MINNMDLDAIKTTSEQQILSLNGKICGWLPSIEHTNPRTLKDIAERALVLNAMIQLAFNAPPKFIRDWILSNGLADALAESEKFIINDPEKKLSEQEVANLEWSIEALWTLMWACGQVFDLKIHEPVGDTLAAMLPNLRNNESASDFYTKLIRRNYEELYGMRDLIYRANWYARDGKLNGYSTEPINQDIIMERRKAIEWSCDDQQDWDNTDQGT